MYNKTHSITNSVHNVAFVLACCIQVDQTINLFVGTWNFAGKDPNEDDKIIDWLYPIKNSASPDIYVIGLQEIVELNIENIIFSLNEKQIKKWTDIILQNLSNIDKFIFM